ncbi:12044_t:CDS:2 [Entrophospora sp. SA101]|nr:16573_t:CDS:2 [Entrophospora sp. SA101]CAJ0842658.1 12044_t:CDS:2 [Entrophospora sp. SA101]
MSNILSENNNLFDKTHPELSELNEEFQELQNNFISPLDIQAEDIIGIDETDESEVSDDELDNTNGSIFSDLEIQKFRNIYCKNSVEIDSDELVTTQEKIDQKNEESKAYILNILKTKCCNKDCLTNIDQESAILRYKNYNNLNKNEQNIFLLGVVSASIKNPMNTINNYMTLKYIYDGDELETKEPIGLTPTRQWYLYDEIRDFVQNPIKKDIICPEPTVARP